MNVDVTYIIATIIVGVAGPYLGYRAAQNKSRQDTVAAKATADTQQRLEEYNRARQDRLDVIEFYKLQLVEERTEKKELTDQVKELQRLWSEANTLAQQCAIELTRAKEQAKV